MASKIIMHKTPDQVNGCHSKSNALQQANDRNTAATMSAELPVQELQLTKKISSVSLCAIESMKCLCMKERSDCSVSQFNHKHSVVDILFCLRYKAFF